MLFGCIVITIILYVNFLLVDANAYLPEGKTVLIYGLIFVYNFQYLTIPLIVIYNFLKRKNVEKFLKLLETFDDHTDKMGWKFKINHERNYWTLIFWIVLQIVLLIVVFLLQFFWVPTVEHVLKDYINSLYYCIITNTFILCSLQLIYGAQCVESRFEILNKNAR